MKGDTFSIFDPARFWFSNVMEQRSEPCNAKIKIFGCIRSYVRDAGPLLNELNVLTRCDCTTRNERKALMLSQRMDELESRIAELAKHEELAALRPELDGAQVMEMLSIGAGRQVGDALKFLMEVRLEEGLLGDAEIRRRLEQWWATKTD